ncbi:MAG: hypothetical protein CR993_01900 [Rhodobacterales bacterium]|nr:MAG: hypothetical protein CR993_01900 [Rhodobacterales bacterium]
MTPERAEELVILALVWLAGNEELLPVFLGATGAGEADLRALAQEPGFLSGVLDFLTLDDRWIAEFCDQNGVAYQESLAAKQVLNGGEMHWT